MMPTVHAGEGGVARAGPDLRGRQRDGEPAAAEDGRHGLSGLPRVVRDRGGDTLPTTDLLGSAIGSDAVAPPMMPTVREGEGGVAGAGPDLRGRRHDGEPVATDDGRHGPLEFPRVMRDGGGDTLPITLVPQDIGAFKVALLRSREARIFETYRDGRTEERPPWKAYKMSASSNVIGNLRSRPRYRAGIWKRLGIESLTVIVKQS
jgi:hypothetical protein